jgi:hypothetical protein
MRSIFVGIIVVSASAAVLHTAEARNLARSQSDYGYMQAAVGHRQPTQDDVAGANQVQIDKKRIEKDNELLDLAPTHYEVMGADELRSKDNAFARMIGRENSRVDRAISGICRGC